MSDIQTRVNSYDQNDRKAVLKQLKNFIDAEIKRDELAGYSEQFRNTMLYNLKPENFFTEEDDEGEVPIALIDLAKQLKCKDYSNKI